MRSYPNLYTKDIFLEDCEMLIFSNIYLVTCVRCHCMTQQEWANRNTPEKEFNKWNEWIISRVWTQNMQFWTSMWWCLKGHNISSVYKKEMPTATDRSVTDHETSTWSSRAAASTQTVQPLIERHSPPPGPPDNHRPSFNNTASSTTQEKFSWGRRRRKGVKKMGRKKPQFRAVIIWTHGILGCQE